MKYERHFGVMWVWTWGDPVVIIYSVDDEGRMEFHSIKAAEAYTESESD